MIKDKNKPTRLTPKEKIKVAHGYFNLEINQHDLVSLFSVNPGRVAEACNTIWNAASDNKDKKPEK